MKLTTWGAIFFMIGSAQLSAQSNADSLSKKQSCEKAAKDLSNLNTPTATSHFKLRPYYYEGILPDEQQSALEFIIQPSFPFRLRNGNLLFIRPGIPMWFSKPFINTSGKLETSTGFGDLSLDLGYGLEFKNDLKLGIGILNTFPTATANLDNKAFISGPTVILIRQFTRSTISINLRNQWSFGAPVADKFNLSTIYPSITFLTGNGWNIGSDPELDFDHITDQWKIPININFGKTNYTRNKKIWKFFAEINYYVVRAASLSPKWYINIDISPVIRNFFVRNI